MARAGKQQGHQRIHLKEFVDKAVARGLLPSGAPKRMPSLPQPAFPAGRLVLGMLVLLLVLLFAKEVRGGHPDISHPDASPLAPVLDIYAVSGGVSIESAIGLHWSLRDPVQDRGINTFSAIADVAASSAAAPWTPDVRRLSRRGTRRAAASAG